jgi:Mn2+/Fe2+ NRAMP family transporter
MRYLARAFGMRCPLADEARIASKRLGPGLITGASDDDPSGIGTYSQAGALRRRHVMGKLVVEGWLYWLGWASTAAMALCIVGMAVSMLMPGSS